MVKQNRTPFLSLPLSIFNRNKTQSWLLLPLLKAQSTDLWGVGCWPPYPCRQPILMGDSPPTFLQGGWRGAVPGRTLLAVLSFLVWLRRGYLLWVRLVNGEVNPISAGWLSGWGRGTFVISRYCVVNFRCQDQNFTFTGRRLPILARSVLQKPSLLHLSQPSAYISTAQPDSAPCGSFIPPSSTFHADGRSSCPGSPSH